MEATVTGNGAALWTREEEEAKISRLEQSAEELLRQEGRASSEGRIGEALRLNARRLGLQAEASRLRLRLISGGFGLG